MKPRSLVTGGAGFIGSHLVDRLIASGRAVTVLDDLSSGSRRNLAAAEAAGGDLRIVEASVLDRQALAAAMQGCERVFHLAVQCVRRSLGRPIENHDINATGTLLALDEARRQNVARFVYCSSSEVYGNCGGERMDEETTVCRPATVYGGAKLVGEHYTHAYRETYGLPSVVVRPFNAYGPRAHVGGDLAEVIPRFVIRVLNGLPPVVFGDGGNGRDFTHVTEVADGIARAGEGDAVVGRTVNIAYGRMVTVREIAGLVCALCGRPDLMPVFTAARPGDVHALQADTARARQLLGFAAAIAFERGLAQYIDWFRQAYPDPRSLLEHDSRNWEMPPGAAAQAVPARAVAS